MYLRNLFFKYSFKKSFTVVLTTFAIITFVIGFVFLYHEILAAKSEVYLAERQAAKVTVDQIMFFRKSVIAYVEAVSKCPAIISGEPAKRQQALKGHFLGDLVDSLCLLDAEDKVMARVPTSASTGNNNFSINYRIYDKTELRDSFIVGTDKNIYMCISRATKFGSTKMRVAATADLNRTINLSSIKYLKNDKLGASYIVDTSGNPLVYLTGEKIRTIPVGIKNVMKKGQGNVSRGNSAYMAVYQNIPGTEWGVVVLVSEDEILGPIYQLGWKLVIGLAVSVILLALLTAKWADKLLEPISRIKDGFSEVAAGNFDVSVDVKGPEEFCYLAKSFNTMLNKVCQIREKERIKLRNDSLYEKLAAMSDVAAGTAHEIRNPLTSIKGFACLVQDKFKNGEQGWQYAEIIKKEAGQIEGIVEQFLLMAAPTFTFFKRYSIHELIDEVLPNIAWEASGTPVQFETDFEDLVLAVFADRPQIKQLLKNLCNNSIEAMTNGGKLIIQTKFNPCKQSVSITVKDNGAGMSPSALEKIANPFYTTRENKLGLGLTVCYRIVQNHQGFLQIVSSEGIGTTCTFELPVVVVTDKAESA